MSPHQGPVPAIRRLLEGMTEHMCRMYQPNGVSTCKRARVVSQPHDMPQEQEIPDKIRDTWVDTNV